MHIRPGLANQSPASYAFILVITLLPLYIASYHIRLAHPYGGTAASRSRTPSKNFVNDWLDVHVVSPFNPSAIGAYCNRTTWHPDLIFNLENANGGIGNVRGNMLDFLIFAIEAGASIMLPGMASRSDDDISNVWANRAPFARMFDQEWFVQAMASACPQMTIYQPPGKDEEPMKTPLPGNYLPRSRRMDADFGNSRAAYRDHLNEWLEAKPEFKHGELTIVNLERTLWEVDTRSLPRDVRRNVAQLLRINPEVRRLAAVVSKRLAEAFHLPIDPEDVIPSKAFYGAHLRTEDDARNAGWLNEPNTNFSAQTDAYMAHAMQHNLRVIYVATGNASEFTRFKGKAAAHRPAIQVTSKFELLDPEAAAQMEQLTWDQQALVDYEVLTRSSVFGGFVKSSFSYNIAMTRNQYLEDQGRVLDPWFVVHRDPTVCFDDGASRIVGRDGWHEMRIPRGMWP